MFLGYAMMALSAICFVLIFALLLRKKPNDELSCWGIVFLFLFGIALGLGGGEIKDTHYCKERTYELSLDK